MTTSSTLMSQTGSTGAGPSGPLGQIADMQILYPEDEIAERVAAMARAIATHPGMSHHAERVVAVCALQGSFIFAADLLRALTREGLDPEVTFVQFASYGKGTTSSGSVTLVKDLQVDVSGRPVLFIDDILDSGRTLNYAIEHLRARGAWSVHSAVLLDKQVPRAVSIEADFAGFTCPDVFVVGYGMDAAGRHRSLPHVAILGRDESA